MRIALAALVALVLAGCSKPATYQRYSDQKTEAPDRETASSGSPAEDPPAETSDASKTAATGAVPSGRPMLAYSYTFAVQAPPQRIASLLARQESQCTAAGPSICVVTGSKTDEQPKGQLTAELSLRATPAWVDSFRKSLGADLERGGGRLTGQSMSSEDLSRQIVDSDAELRAKTALRDRLQQILDKRPGTTKDLVEVEKALSDAQGEVDKINSELAAMRLRIATSDVTVDYTASGVMMPKDVGFPITSALNGFVGDLATAIAAIVTLIAYALPFVALGIPAAYLIRKRRRRNAPPNKATT